MIPLRYAGPPMARIPTVCTQKLLKSDIGGVSVPWQSLAELECCCILSSTDWWCLGVKRPADAVSQRRPRDWQKRIETLPFLTAASHHLLVASQSFSQLVPNQAPVLNRIFINSEYCTAASYAGINSHLSSPNQLPAQWSIFFKFRFSYLFSIQKKLCKKWAVYRLGQFRGVDLSTSSSSTYLTVETDIFISIIISAIVLTTDYNISARIKVKKVKKQSHDTLPSPFTHRR